MGKNEYIPNWLSQSMGKSKMLKYFFDILLPQKKLPINLKHKLKRKMKRQPRTVKNSKLKRKEELDSSNSNKFPVLKSRRRRKIINTDLSRKQITVCKRTNNNTSKISISEIEKNNKFVEIQRKIEELKNEKKKLEDPSFSSFKQIEDKQISINLLKKDKKEILSIISIGIMY